VTAEDEEIEPFIKSRLFAADITSDDPEATVYETQQFEAISSIPNLKLGALISEQILTRMRNYRNGIRHKNDYQFLSCYRNQLIQNLLVGLYTRMESILIGAAMGRLSWSSLGIKSDNIWDMPSDLNIILATPFRYAERSDSVDAIRHVIAVGKKYNVDYDRITMATKTFKELINTRQLRSQANLDKYGKDLEKVLKAVADFFNVKLELYDKTMLTRTPDGNSRRERLLPEGKIIFSSSKLDNKPETLDWADAPVTECLDILKSKTRKNKLANKNHLTGYFRGNSDTNPTQVRAWAVRRGWSRRHNKAVTACLTV
jgi:hypothetical protein